MPSKFGLIVKSFPTSFTEETTLCFAAILKFKKQRSRGLGMLSCMHAHMHGARMAWENTAYSTRVAIRYRLYPTVVYTRSIQVYKGVMLGYTGGRARGCAGNHIRARGSGVIRREGSHIRAMSATRLPSTSFAVACWHRLQV